MPALRDWASSIGAVLGGVVDEDVDRAGRGGQRPDGGRIGEVGLQQLGRGAQVAAQPGDRLGLLGGRQVVQQQRVAGPGQTDRQSCADAPPGTGDQDALTHAVHLRTTSTAVGVSGAATIIREENASRCATIIREEDANGYATIPPGRATRSKRPESLYPSLGCKRQFVCRYRARPSWKS
jgi:hypothetical protein